MFVKRNQYVRLLRLQKEVFACRKVKCKLENITSSSRSYSNCGCFFTRKSRTFPFEIRRAVEMFRDPIHAEALNFRCSTTNAG